MEIESAANESAMSADRFPVSPGAKLGFLGPSHSFSHELAQKDFAHCAHIQFSSFSEGFPRLVRGDFDFLLIPFFNTNGADVIEAQKEIVKHRGQTFVNDLVCLDVSHCACGYGAIGNVTRVVSKAPVEKQISQWLKKTVPGATFFGCESTSLAIQSLANEKDPSVCAVGSPKAAEEYGVPILMKEIENKPNRTLFFLLSKTSRLVTDMDNALLGVSPCSPQQFRAVEAIADEHGCGISAASRFTIDGAKHAYFEIASDGANLNLSTAVQQILAQVPDSAVLGGYKKTSIVTLVNQ